MTEFEFLDIMHRAEMLKNNTRHSWTSQDRHESVAEHSWRLAFMVLMYSYELKKEFPKVDIDKVLRMCIIHDLGEAFTGDIPSFYKTDADSVKESDILLDWFRSMPAPFDTELPALWEEMEALETTEARIYKAFGVDLPAQVIDKIEAVVQHDEAKLSTWLPLERELQLTYGAENMKFSKTIEKLRDVIDEETRKKIAEGR